MCRGAGAPGGRHVDGGCRRGSRVCHRRSWPTPACRSARRSPAARPGSGRTCTCCRRTRRQPSSTRSRPTGGQPYPRARTRDEDPDTHRSRLSAVREARPPVGLTPCSVRPAARGFTAIATVTEGVHSTIFAASPLDGSARRGQSLGRMYAREFRDAASADTPSAVVEECAVLRYCWTLRWLPPALLPALTPWS